MKVLRRSRTSNSSPAGDEIRFVPDLTRQPGECWLDPALRRAVRIHQARLNASNGLRQLALASRPTLRQAQRG